MKRRRVGFSSSNKKQKSCKSSGKKEDPHSSLIEREFGSISDYGQAAWDKLTREIVHNLSETVVAVDSYVEKKRYFGCTGIVVKSNRNGASILTSASLFRSVRDGGKKIPVLIQVRLPNNRVTVGRVAHYDLHYNIAVIVTPPFPRLRTASFDVHKHFGSHSKVVAVGRWFYSGKLMATTGILTDEPIGVYPEHLRISTCKIPLVMTGGPLIDSDGYLVGMNFYSKRRTPLLPSSIIFDFLVLKGIIEHEGPYLILESTSESPCRIESKHDGPGLILKSSSERPLRSLLCNSECTPSEENEPEEFMDLESLLPPDFHEPLPVDEFTQLLRNDLQSRGYCMPTRLESGMRLVNTFEEEFAEDTWCKLSKKIASNIPRSVVSLASFKGKERFFACTGIFIDFNEPTSRVLTSASLVRTSADENKIDDNLEIKVYLPNKLVAIGTLQHYNLSYNLAVVSIVGFRCLRTAKFQNQVQIEPHKEVVAVGRIFESGKLMATSGIVAGNESELDCKELMVSTCKITKAGIGGPLVDVDGNFIGMNFYGMKGTHFLPTNVILELLKCCGAERAIAGEAMDNKPNRWPVPVPRWSYPSSRSLRWRRRPRRE